MRVSSRSEAPTSPSTRSVIPTLVAASAAPTKRWCFIDVSGIHSSIRPAPSAIGTTTPIPATLPARPTTFRIWASEESRPAWNRSSTRPSSARNSRGRSGHGGPTSHPRRSRLPMTIPTATSPVTGGCRSRRASPPPMRAANNRAASDNHADAGIIPLAISIGMPSTTATVSKKPPISPRIRHFRVDVCEVHERRLLPCHAPLNGELASPAGSVDGFPSQ